MAKQPLLLAFLRILLLHPLCQPRPSPKFQHQSALQLATRRCSILLTSGQLCCFPVAFPASTSIERSNDLTTTTRAKVSFTTITTQHIPYTQAKRGKKMGQSRWRSPLLMILLQRRGSTKEEGRQANELGGGGGEWSELCVDVRAQGRWIDFPQKLKKTQGPVHDVFVGAVGHKL